MDGLRQNMEIVFHIAFIAVLLRVSYTDLRYQRIDDEWIAAILILSILAIPVMNNVTLFSRLVGGVCVSFPMLLITTLYPGAFGGGDVKLMAAGGCFLGAEKILASVVPAIFSACAYFLYLLIVKLAGRNTVFSLGPFLCLGMVAVFIIK